MSYEITKEKHLSDQEHRELLETLKTLRPKSERNYLLLSLMMATGARGCEILGILTTDLDFENKSVFIRGAKKGKSREFPIEEELFTSLHNYATSLSTPRLFPISSQHLRHIWGKYRPNPNKGIHSLRHLFAINLYRRHRDVRLVQTALGHRSIQNTMVYAEYIYSTEELRRLMLTAPEKRTRDGA